MMVTSERGLLELLTENGAGFKTPLTENDAGLLPVALGLQLLVDSLDIY